MLHRGDGNKVMYHTLVEMNSYSNRFCLPNIQSQENERLAPKVGYYSVVGVILR